MLAIVGGVLALLNAGTTLVDLLAALMQNHVLVISILLVLLVIWKVVEIVIGVVKIILAERLLIKHVLCLVTLALVLINLIVALALTLLVVIGVLVLEPVKTPTQAIAPFLLLVVMDIVNKKELVVALFAVVYLVVVGALFKVNAMMSTLLPA